MSAYARSLSPARDYFHLHSLAFALTKRFRSTYGRSIDFGDPINKSVDFFCAPENALDCRSLRSRRIACSPQQGRVGRVGRVFCTLELKKPVNEQTVYQALARYILCSFSGFLEYCHRKTLSTLVTLPSVLWLHPQKRPPVLAPPARARPGL